MRPYALALLASVALAATPTLSLNPKAGPPASYTAATGSGFAPNETVNIFFDSAPAATATAGATGGFAGIHVPIPASAIPGAYPLSAQGSQSGLSAQIQFLVRADWKELARGP